MHQPPIVVIERIAPVHGATVVPHDHVVYLPLLGPGKLRAASVLPQFVEQSLALRNRKSFDIGIDTAPEKHTELIIFRVIAASIQPNYTALFDNRVDGR